jgi:hypothetical protein
VEWLGLVIASLTEFWDWKHSLVIWQFLQNMGRLENFWKEVLDILPFPRASKSACLLELEGDWIHLGEILVHNAGW